MVFFFIPVEDVTTGMSIPESDGPEAGDAGIDPAIEKMQNDLAKMQVTDEPDAVTIELPKTHEKADIIMAYSTVPGTCIHKKNNFNTYIKEQLIV